ncbi:MAG: hypothetical protein LBF72_01825 [Holosporales bacterium]|nr:hypothetical protein [Holosporales bacterium]
MYREQKHSDCVVVLSAIAAMLLVTSCATDFGTSTYQAANLGQAQTTLHGVVLSVREIALESTDALAPALGAGLGSIAGALIGGSNNRLTGAALGGVAGAAGGHIVKPTKKQKGFEYEVRADDGHMYTIVQGPDVVLAAGQRVSIVLPSGGNRGRLLPITS